MKESDKHMYFSFHFMYILVGYHVPYYGNFQTIFSGCLEDTLWSVLDL